MDFNESQLINIKKDISGMFKKSARKTVALQLGIFKARIKEIESLPKSEKRGKSLDLLNEAQAMRHNALRQGARSGSHPNWAAAAACESWAAALLHRQSGVIDDATLSRIDELINDLIKNH